jgi:para-aminobenzoate synthetase/4-amino-4-deoxychorismate lyase
MRLRAVVLPGGLGAHKWADRTLIDLLSGPDVTPLFCDLDGHVLETGYAAIAIVESGVLIAPPLDGRLLPSISRARLLATSEHRIEPITLERLQSADQIVLTSALRMAVQPAG